MPGLRGSRLGDACNKFSPSKNPDEVGSRWYVGQSFFPTYHLRYITYHLTPGT